MLRALRDRYGERLDVCVMDPRNPLAFFDNFRYRVRPSRPMWVLGRDKLCDGIPDLETLQEAIDRRLP